MLYTLIVLSLLSVIHSVRIDRVSSILNGKPLQNSITNDVLKSAYPYIAILEEKEIPTCGSVIISPSILLTAAHCVYNGKAKHFQIRAGTYWKYDNRPNKVQIRQVHKIRIHKKLDKPTYMANDIALILLSEELEFSRFINKIDLPKISNQRTMYGETATFVGWGRSEKEPLIDVLHETKMILIDNNQCQQLMKSKIKVDPSMICALGKYRDNGGCVGDSGGPLVLSGWGESGKDVLVGITSFMVYQDENYDICNPKYPTVFVNTSALIPWIEENLVKLNSIEKQSTKKSWLCC